MVAPSTNGAMTQDRLRSMKKSDLIRWLKQKRVDLPAKNHFKDYYLTLALRKHAELAGDDGRTPSTERKKRGRPRKSSPSTRSKSPYSSRSKSAAEKQQQGGSSSHQHDQEHEASPRLVNYSFSHTNGFFKLLRFGIGKSTALRWVFIVAALVGLLGYACHFREMQRRRKWCWQR